MTCVSRIRILRSMSTTPIAPAWSFLTNHARVLLCIARDPEIRLRVIGEEVGITERAAYRIVDELVAAGYVSRERTAPGSHPPHAIARTTARDPGTPGQPCKRVLAPARRTLAATWR
jgi:hypothetical protein